MDIEIVRVKDIIIECLDPEIDKPVVPGNGDWIDVRCAKQITMKDFDPNSHFCLVPLGIKVELPKNHFAILAPRSSLYMKKGVLMANSVGVIDERFRQEWCFPAYLPNWRNNSEVVFEKNERIAQFHIFPNDDACPNLIFDTVEEVGRGAGFGSSGGYANG